MTVNGIRQVVQGNYCIGCGACAAIAPRLIELHRTGNGLYQPVSRVQQSLPDDDVSRVCPFTSGSKNEDTLGRQLFGNAPQHSPFLGHYRDIWAGHVTEDGYRDSGSSGGMGSWLLAEALREGLVDYVIHVREGGAANEAIFGYAIAEDVATVRTGAKSRYYPIELSQVVQHVRDVPGRYAFVGIPCFLKALRNICALDEIVNARVVLFVGLFCGHMKTGDFASSLAWQLGIPPGDLASVDFRRKLTNRPAKDYGFSARSKTGEEIEAPMAKLFGREWGLGLFKPHACEFCDDVVGELADVSVGDAWLPEFVGDPKGTNVLIVRTEAVAQLIANARRDGRLALKPLSAQDAYKSQLGGFHHRRDGLAYRLWLKDRKKIWRPPKRVMPRRSHLGLIHRNIYRLRSYLSERSHIAFATAKRQGSFDVFVKEMNPIIAKYRRLQLADYYAKRLKQVVRQWLRLPPV
jgi:coenzyme F420-reducing hydrogenase beta subunit